MATPEVYLMASIDDVAAFIANLDETSRGRSRLRGTLARIRFRFLVLLMVACNTDKPASDADKPALSPRPSVADADACTRAVLHVNELIAVESNSHGLPPIGAVEQRAVDLAVKGSITQCRSEGLSPAQLDCVLTAKDWDGFRHVGDCPAIQARRPTWLRIP